MAKWPLPPFFPAGPVILFGRWNDQGEWDDEDIMFPGTPPPPEIGVDYLIDQNGNIVWTQDGKYIIL